MQSWSTERLVLSQLGPESARAVAEYLSSAREYHAPWEPPRAEDWCSIERVSERLSQEVADARDDKQLVLYISRIGQPDAPVIGRIALNNIIRGALQGCSVGYALSPEATGEGLMTEALSRAVKVAFLDLNLHRVEVNVVPRNAASIAVAERCGFEKEGVSRAFLYIAGTWEDHVRYVRINEAWTPE